MKNRVRDIKIEEIGERIGKKVKKREMKVEDVMIKSKNKEMSRIESKMKEDIDMILEDMRILIGIERKKMEVKERLGKILIRIEEEKIKGELVRMECIERMEKKEKK